MYVHRNTEARSGNHRCRGKAVSIVSVAVVIQHAKRMGRIILSLVASMALSHFSTSTHKWHDIRKKLLNQRKYVLIFSTTCT